MFQKKKSHIGLSLYLISSLFLFILIFMLALLSYYILNNLDIWTDGQPRITTVAFMPRRIVGVMNACINTDDGCVTHTCCYTDGVRGTSYP